MLGVAIVIGIIVTTQAHEGIETLIKYGKDKTAKRNNSSP